MKKIGAIVGVIAAIIVMIFAFIFFMFSWFVCTVSFGIFASDYCKDDPERAATISEDQIVDFGKKMKEARDQVKADFKGDLFRMLPVPEKFDEKGNQIKINEAEVYIRVLMQTDAHALTGLDLSDEVLDGDTYSGTNLEKTWKLAKIIKKIESGKKGYKEWTNYDWLIKARLNVYKCYMVGDDPVFAAIFGGGTTPCKLINDYIPEEYQSMLTHTHTIVEEREYCIPKPIEEVEEDTSKTTTAANKNSKSTISLAHHDDKTLKYPYSGTCDGTIGTETTTKTYVTYQNLVYDILFNFDQFSLIEVGKTVPKDDSFKDMTVYLLKVLYGQNFGSESFINSPSSGLFIVPMQANTYRFSSPFGNRDMNGNGSNNHKGVDLAAPVYTPIYAAADGVVTNAGGKPGGAPIGGYANTIVIDHGTYKTLYAHMRTDGILVKQGDTVLQGQLIGGVGNEGISSGPHLHFEICPSDQGTTYLCGNQIDPEDPRFGMVFDKEGKGEGASKAKADVFDKGKAEFIKNGSQAIIMPGFTPMSTVLGSWVAHFESGTTGPTTIAWDSTGGWSYGTFQLAELKGSVEEFAEFLKVNGGQTYYDALSPIEPSTDAFRKRWVDLALKDPNGFNALQFKFTQNNFYNVSVKRLLNMTYPFDPSTRSRSIQEMIWSISVQHGQGGPDNFFKTVYISKGIDPNTKTDIDIINDIFDERSKLHIYFKSSTPDVLEGVRRRFVDERKLLLDRLIQTP